MLGFAGFDSISGHKLARHSNPGPILGIMPKHSFGLLALSPCAKHHGTSASLCSGPQNAIGVILVFIICFSALVKSQGSKLDSLLKPLPTTIKL
jgi:hypothetical protein